MLKKLYYFFFIYIFSIEKSRDRVRVVEILGGRPKFVENQMEVQGSQHQQSRCILNIGGGVQYFFIG